ncbi:hypothetical protein LCGC14_0569960 [marine sediment metagenome]|uniref:Uncharacterized protein n=1 Tax=marine sediment metagenome TaxID=412755 RepID=A0A0F9RPL6_9ZZZZ
MQTNIPNSKEMSNGVGGILIIEADHKQAEKDLFKCTKNAMPKKI